MYTTYSSKFSEFTQKMKFPRFFTGSGGMAYGNKWNKAASDGQTKSADVFHRLRR